MPLPICRLERHSVHKLLMGVVLAVAGAATGTAARADDAAADIYITPEAAQASADFRLQGEYAKPGLGLQVIALGGSKFQAVIHKGGLPGAGWDGSERQPLDEDAEGVQDLITSLELQRVERVSPTLGLAPPSGAVVLFDGTPESLARHWQPGARRTDSGLLMEGATSIDLLGDYTLHLEFLTPFMPRARGQARGNSGVYQQGRYETQVLDSFGLAGKMNESGGIYGIKDPDLNMCLPPLTWQTYDVDFTASRWNAEGKKTSDARMTVRLNGVVVQRDVVLPNVSGGALSPESSEPAPLHLQNHGNPVRFRNIWVLPRDSRKEARRPIVAGFERFTNQPGVNAAAGGRLLIGELACTQCHRADREWAAALLERQPPILTDVGSRLHPEWMVKYLLDPHGVKPGTTMPDVLGSLPEAERAAAVRALVSFLTTSGDLRQARLEAAAARRGDRLFHQVGCIQCHEPRDGSVVATGTSVPLGNLSEKYTVPSLAEFLKAPHKVRPSGRMPAWSLPDKDLQDIAGYLIGDVKLRSLPPNLKVAVYEGSWDELPDFDQLQPVRTLDTVGLDVSVADRENHFGLRFDGFLNLPKRGSYTFYLGSDDGSRLLLNGIEVVRNDGIHPHQTVSAATKLDDGVQAIRVEYFEQGGEESLTLEIEGKSLGRQDITPYLQLTPDAPPPSRSREDDPAAFVPDPSLVDTGRQLFQSLGCANCHLLKFDGREVNSRLQAKALSTLQPDSGCLLPEPPAGLPRFELAPLQTAAISQALAAPPGPEVQQPAAKIDHTMAAFNCYACHSRGGIGGPTADRNALFRTTLPEMGDEGRLPPALDGVGDKLNDGFLREVLKNGASDRPYMQTRMPKFGDSPVSDLAAAFVQLDRREGGPLAEFDEPLHRVKSTGRQLVGDRGLACIKCHNFGPHKATGVQAINLHSMTRRLRDDWFARYLVNPGEYRPGTRMPTGFPEGQAAVRDVYDGDSARQIAAIWRYLEDRDKAGLPDGLVAQLIELKPEQSAIVYRNFIDGLTPRGIAVGFPEHCHLAWDANRLCLATVWHGRFIDASRHWNGRGQGFEPPLGDHVLRIEPTVPLAVLASRDAPWPEASPRERGYRFRGYRLDESGRPTFRYDGPGFAVEDRSVPAAGSPENYFVRRLQITTPERVDGLYFRAAQGRQIEALPDGGYRVDGALTVRLSGGGAPFLRTSAGSRELLVPLDGAGPTEIVQELHW